MASRRYCPQCLTTFGEDAPRCPNLGCGVARPISGWSTILGAGDMLDRHYKVERPLAVGGAGITYLAYEMDAQDEPTGPALAVKVLFEQRDSGPFLRRLSTEAQILQDLAHPHIVECRAFVHRMGHAPYLVTRFEAGGNLADHVQRVGKLSPAVATGVLRQVLLALDVAQTRGVVHRDLKPHNVLLAEPVPSYLVPHVKVADFGIAKVGAGGDGMTMVGGFVGTPEYAAPEQFAGLHATGATDVFAAGALLVFLLTGETPFRYSQRNDIARTYSELSNQLPVRVQAGTHGETQLLQRVLDGMLRRDPAERMPIREILSVIADIAEAPVPVGSGPIAPNSRGMRHLAAAGSTFLLGDVEPPSGPLTAMPPATAQPTPISAVPREAAPRPAAPRPAPRVPPLPTTLDATRRPPEPRPEPVIAAQPSLDDLLAPRSRREPPPTLDLLAPNEPPAFVPPPPPPAAPAAPTLPPPPTTWAPELARPMPPEMPDDTNVLLVLLGEVSVPDRAVILDRLGKAADLVALARAHRPGVPASSRGLAIAIAGLQRADLAPVAGRLLSDPNPTVRACAAEAVAAVGKAGALPPLQRLLADPEPLVRILAAAAVARACAANARADLARRWLEPLVRDAVPSVRAAARAAVASLDV